MFLIQKAISHNLTIKASANEIILQLLLLLTL